MTFRTTLVACTCVALLAFGALGASTKNQKRSTTERVSLVAADRIKAGSVEPTRPTLPNRHLTGDNAEAEELDNDPGSGTMEPAGDDPTAPTDEEAAAPDQDDDFSEVDITLVAVRPEELGFSSVDEMHRAVRARLGIDDARPIHVGHDRKDGKEVITVSVSPK